jgi:hypothetical protein
MNYGNVIDAGLATLFLGLALYQTGYLLTKAFTIYIVVLKDKSADWDFGREVLAGSIFRALFYLCHTAR